MIVELDATNFIWFADFLSNYLYSYDGRNLPNEQKDRLSSIISTEKENSNMYLMEFNEADISLFCDLLEFNTCCCPGCNNKSVKCRKYIQKIMNELMEMVE